MVITTFTIIEIIKVMEAEKPTAENTDFIHGRILPTHITYQDRVLISKLIKESYREGFLNGMAIRPDGHNAPIQEKLTNKK